MIDANALREKYSDLPIEELIKFVFLNSSDFIPGAVPLLKEELQNRVGDLKNIIEGESKKSGIIELVIDGCKCWSERKDYFLKDYFGTVFFTSKGVFFIPSLYKENSAIPAYAAFEG
ncbi:MAG: hypothetical protein HY919_05440 [Elusimicrobia bacterium]|nr:hypothetical protein [Elusimicrobiota bacterium]